MKGERNGWRVETKEMSVSGKKIALSLEEVRAGCEMKEEWKIKYKRKKRNYYEKMEEVD